MKEVYAKRRGLPSAVRLRQNAHRIRQAAEVFAGTRPTAGHGIVITAIEPAPFHIVRNDARAGRVTVKGIR